MSLERQKIGYLDFADLCNDLSHNILKVLDGTGLAGLTEGGRKAFIKSFIEKHKDVMPGFNVDGLDKPILPPNAGLSEIRDFISACVQYRVDSIYQVQAKEKANSIKILMEEFNNVVGRIDDANTMIDRILIHKREEGDKISEVDSNVRGIEVALAEVEAGLEEFKKEFKAIVRVASSLEKPHRDSFMMKMLQNLDVIRGKIRANPPELVLDDETIKNKLLSYIDALIDSREVEVEEEQLFIEKMELVGKILDSIDDSVKGKKSELDGKLQDAKVVPIQAAVRGYIQRTRYLKEKKSAMVIQDAYRSVLSRRAESHEAREIAESLIEKIKVLEANDDLSEVNKLKSNIHKYLSETGFSEKSARIKGIVQDIMMESYPGEFSGDEITASFTSSIGSIAAKNEEYIRGLITTEVEHYKSTVNEALSRAVGGITQDEVEGHFIALESMTMSITDKSLENIQEARDILAGSDDLDLPLKIKLKGISNRERGEFISGSKKSILRQLEISDHLARQVNMRFAQLPDADTVQAVNDIPHVIGDLLKGIDSSQKQKYFGGRSYVGLTRGARNNFFG